jgi:regulator of nucleoside diphosphate kinase
MECQFMHAPQLLMMLLWFTASARSPIWANSRLIRLAGHRLPPFWMICWPRQTSPARAPCARMWSRCIRASNCWMHPQAQVVTLCYPQDAEPAAGFISVLSPVGISLLGLRADVARWQTPHGEECAAVIECIQFQPEASGDYHVAAASATAAPAARPGTTVPALIALHAGATSGGRRCTGAHGPITTTTRTRPP